LLLRLIGLVANFPGFGGEGRNPDPVE